MEISGTVLVASLSLFLAWSGILVGVVLWLSTRFNKIDRAIARRISAEDFSKQQETVIRRLTTIERWALRLNGSVKINFAEVSAPDYRAHGD